MGSGPSTGNLIFGAAALFVVLRVASTAYKQRQRLLSRASQLPLRSVASESSVTLPKSKGSKAERGGKAANGFKGSNGRAAPSARRGITTGARHAPYASVRSEEDSFGGDGADDDGDEDILGDEESEVRQNARAKRRGEVHSHELFKGRARQSVYDDQGDDDQEYDGATVIDPENVPFPEIAPTEVMASNSTKESGGLMFGRARR